MIGLTVRLEGADLFRELIDKVSDTGRLSSYAAASLAVGTREHLIEAAKTRHKTASSLGASPTNYLARKASTVDHRVMDGRAEVTLAGEREIFARFLGEVTVRPLRSKYLTVPVHPQAYGMRAREIGGLRVFGVSRKHFELLDQVNARPATGGSRGSMDMGEVPLALGYVSTSSTGDAREHKAGKRYYVVMFLLAVETTLTADRGLLPDMPRIAIMLERAAADFIDLEPETAYV